MPKSLSGSKYKNMNNNDFDKAIRVQLGDEKYKQLLENKELMLEIEQLKLKGNRLSNNDKVKILEKVKRIVYSV